MRSRTTIIHVYCNYVRSYFYVVAWLQKTVFDIESVNISLISFCPAIILTKICKNFTNVDV